MTTIKNIVLVLIIIALVGFGITQMFGSAVIMLAGANTTDGELLIFSGATSLIFIGVLVTISVIAIAKKISNR